MFFSCLSNVTKTTSSLLNLVSGCNDDDRLKVGIKNILYAFFHCFTHMLIVYSSLYPRKTEQLFGGQCVGYIVTDDSFLFQFLQASW